MTRGASRSRSAIRTTGPGRPPTTCSRPTRIPASRSGATRDTKPERPRPRPARKGPPMVRRPRRRPGVTLIEVLLVMALILALGAIAYPTLSAMYGDVRVKAAADDVRAALTEARAQA